MFGLASLGLAGAAQADAPPPSALERTIPREAEHATDRPAVVIPKQATAPATTKRRFTLGAVNIDGATIFSEQQLSRYFEPYLATEVDDAKLAQIAEAITAQYHRSGYILSFATVPAQNVEAGMVRLQVVEGRIANLAIIGAGASTNALRSIARPLVQDGPLKRASLERTLGLMRDFPGIRIVDIALVQSDVLSGLYTLKIKVVPNRIRAFAYFDNRGIAGMGRMRLFTSTAVASVAEPGDELRADLFGMPGNRARYAYGQVFAATPLGHNGLKFSISASRGYQHLRAGEHFDGRSDTVTGELSYPLRRSRDFSVIGKASLVDSLTVGTASGTQKLRDHLRVARLGVGFLSEGRSQLLGDLIFSEGLGFPGMTLSGDPRASRPGASGKFTKVAASLQVIHPLNPHLTLRATAIGQYADRPLLAAEEFSLGGNRVGRAFAFNVSMGARGAGAGIELGYRLDGSRKGGQGPEIFGFADDGVATNPATPTSIATHQPLSSAGAGVRFNIAGLSASLEAGVPLSRSAHHSPRYYVTVYRAL